MFDLKNLFARALLALMLVTGSGAALAGPTYHVTVDARGYTGTGVLDFVFLGYEWSPVTRAFLSNFTGDYAGAGTFEGDAEGSIAGGVVLGMREPFSSFAQMVNLGGRFGFDLRFDVDPASEPVSLSIGLFSHALDQYMGSSGTLVSFELVPGQPDLVVVDASLAQVSAVPEPATVASLVLGLALMGWTLRLRRRG